MLDRFTLFLGFGIAAALCSIAVKLQFLPDGHDQWLTPLATIGIAAWAISRAQAGAERSLMAIALICAIIADICLAINDGLPIIFLAGLGFFLVMQAIYAAVFVRRIGAVERPLGFRILVSFTSFVVCAGSIASIVLLGNVFTGAMDQGIGMFIAVIVYAIAITMMVSQAIAAWIITKARRTTYGFAALGAVIFVVSDMLIAIGNFGSVTIAYGGVGVLVTYWTAQILIAGSLKS